MITKYTSIDFTLLFALIIIWFIKRHITILFTIIIIEACHNIY